MPQYGSLTCCEVRVMKRILSLICAAWLILALALCTAATEAPGARLADMAGLLTETEAAQVTAALDRYSEECGCDLVVVTVTTTGEKSVMEYADDYYDYGGYGKDGALLLLCMDTREWWISTAGKCIRLSEDGMERADEAMRRGLHRGDFAAAFESFASGYGELIETERPGSPRASWLVGSLAAGLIVAFVGTLIMKGKLKTVRSQAAAGSYIRTGSLNITRAHEFFLYRNVTRVRRDTEGGHGGGGGSHRSSSGASHGGHGGRF